MALRNKEGYNAYQRQNHIVRYRRLISQWKVELGNKCVDCGSNEDLQFDHVDPDTKLFSVSVGWAYSVEMVRAEIKKCVLRCEPCHRIRTASQQSVPHGGGLSGKRNCPCSLCKARMREYMKEWRRKRKPASIA